MRRSRIAVRHLLLSCSLVLPLVSAGCRPVNDDTPAVRTDGRAPADTAAPVTLWREEALADQPRLEQLRVASANMGYSPASTNWQVDDIRLPPELTGAGTDTLLGGSPGTLLAALATSIGGTDPLGTDAWETTLRVYREADERATGVILMWGLQDDAIAGRDWRARMHRRAGRWHVTTLERREHCARGVSSEGLCL